MAENSSGDYENWMTNLPQRARTVELTNLAIPGSHNSFSYGLDQSAPFAPDLDPSLSTAANALATFLPMVRGTVHNWSKTQKFGLLDQLKAGIRYFDCRVGLHTQSGKVRFLHGLWGPIVGEELAQLKSFLDNHPGEVIFLDFNHFYEMGDDDHVVFAAELISLLGDYLIPFNEFSGSDGQVTWVTWDRLTLAKLAEEMPRRKVILFYADDTGVALSDLKFWPHSTIEAPWPRVQNATAMIQFHEEKVCATMGRCRNKFYVCQGIITPDGNMIMHNLTKNFYDHFGCQATAAFVNWLSSKQQPGCDQKAAVCNIFIADSVELGLFIPTVLAFNNLL